MAGANLGRGWRQVALLELIDCQSDRKHGLMKENGRDASSPDQGFSWPAVGHATSVVPLTATISDLGTTPLKSAATPSFLTICWKQSAMPLKTGSPGFLATCSLVLITVDRRICCGGTRS